MGKKIFYVVNVDWFFLSHRLPLALEAQKRGYTVTIVAIETDKRDEIRSYGFDFIPIPTSRSGTNMLNELKVLFFFLNLYGKARPDIVHHVGIKPVTYGSVAARILRLPKVVNAIAGMGYLFINKDQNRIAHTIVTRLFKYGFRNPNLRLILQNNDDLADVVKLDVLDPKQIYLVKGSGVDIDDFVYTPPTQSNQVKVILSARMLWDKGVGEFVEAARLLHHKYGTRIACVLAGGVDMENNSAIPEAQLTEWDKEGCVSWIGFQHDMKSVLVGADIVTLPSYREGLPKSLIEACAIGRPVVTTDVPGCREVVVNGENGLLVPVKDGKALADALCILIDDPAKREAMGRKGRTMAENTFSLSSVVAKTFDIYNS